MAMNAISNAVRTSLVTILTTALDQGSGAGKLRIFTAAFATMLSEHAFSDPSAASITNGVTTLDSIADDTALDTGVAAVCRFVDSDNTTLWEGTVGTSGADVNLNSTSISSGVTVSITSGTLTQPAA